MVQGHSVRKELAVYPWMAVGHEPRRPAGPRDAQSRFSRDPIEEIFSFLSLSSQVLFAECLANTDQRREV